MWHSCFRHFFLAAESLKTSFMHISIAFDFRWAHGTAHGNKTSSIGLFILVIKGVSVWRSWTKSWFLITSLKSNCCHKHITGSCIGLCIFVFCHRFSLHVTHIQTILSSPRPFLPFNYFPPAFHHPTSSVYVSGTLKAWQNRAKWKCVEHPVVYASALHCNAFLILNKRKHTLKPVAHHFKETCQSFQKLWQIGANPFQFQCSPVQGKSPFVGLSVNKFAIYKQFRKSW